MRLDFNDSKEKSYAILKIVKCMALKLRCNKPCVILPSGVGTKGQVLLVVLFFNEMQPKEKRLPSNL